jgi:tRNA (cmo5U34)-methyltransferase
VPLESDLIAGERWVFDEAVADSFDGMLARSIPEYESMRAAVAAVGLRFGDEGSFALDLGCSRGDALAPFVQAGWGAVGYEISEPMLTAARKRFWDNDHVSVVSHDLRLPLVLPPHADVVLLVLTLMFVPMNYRQRVLRDAYASLRPGGALIFVEKVLGAGILDDVFVSAYHEMKGGNGYTADEIRRKQLALEGVLVPLTAEMNETMLDNAGFKPVDCFYASLNFRGWVAVK